MDKMTGSRAAEKAALWKHNFYTAVALNKVNYILLSIVLDSDEDI